MLSDVLDEEYPAPKVIQVQAAQLERSAHQGDLALDLKETEDHQDDLDLLV